MRILAYIFVCCLALTLRAQTPLTSNYFNYHLVDRQEILEGRFNPEVHTSVKPYNRSRSLFLPIKEASKVDEFNTRYLSMDHPFQTDSLVTNKGVFHSFYITPSAFYIVNQSDLQLIVNPLLNFGLGNDSGFVNTRGIEIRGSIGQKVGFYANISENQHRPFNHLIQHTLDHGVINGATFIKPYDNGSYDYFNAVGYFTFSPIKEIMFQFGQDRNFIGNGIRSMILSDQAAAYPFAKIKTKVWKLHYTNLFSQMVDFTGLPEGKALNRKFSALHHLSVNVTDNLNIGFFENVIFDRLDSNESNNFDIQYLNPLIFYRSVEHSLNSTDNVLLGLDFKWNSFNRFSLYGQLVFDEFVKDEFVRFTDHWSNKWAYQLGLKYINVGNVSNLDLQLELNQARPFVYSHKFQAQNWAHYNQAMAHPLGANFREFIAVVRYQPADRLNLSFTLVKSKQGLDSNGTNIYGANIFVDNRGVLNRENAPMFQGILSNNQLLSFEASYMLYHNLFIDGGAHYVTRSGEDSYLLVETGLRLNMRKRNLY